MTTGEFRFEGKFSIKDGKKWKNRYCVFKQPTKLLDHFKLHLYKDRDDYLNRLKQIDGSPAPFEDVLGCEIGYCIDRDHQYCILMVGRRSVFFICYPDFQQMYSWGANLGNVLNCRYFRVTLEMVEGNRSASRQPGSLHIQRSRLCFIRELDNNLWKFNCAWEIKDVKSYGISEGFFCIEVGSRAPKNSGKYYFSCVSEELLLELQKAVAKSLSDRVVTSTSGNSPPRVPPGPSPPTSRIINPQSRRLRDPHFSPPLPPPPLPPPPTPPPPSTPPPPLSSPLRVSQPGCHEMVNGADSTSCYGDAVCCEEPCPSPSHLHPSPPRLAGSHECLGRGSSIKTVEDMFPNRTLTRSCKKSASECPNPGNTSPSLLRPMQSCDEDSARSSTSEHKRLDLFHRSNSLNIQSPKEKSSNIFQRFFKRRSRSETDFSGGGSASGGKDAPSSSQMVDTDADDEVFEASQPWSTASSSPPEGATPVAATAAAADVSLSPIREDRTSGPNLQPSGRIRSASASFGNTFRLPSTGSAGGGPTIKRTPNNSDSMDGMLGLSISPKKSDSSKEMVIYPGFAFDNGGGRESTSTSSYNVQPSGYVTLSGTHRRGLQRSHSTVSGSSHHSSVPLANTTQVLTSKPRFGTEYVPCQTLRSVSQCTADSSGCQSSTGGTGSPLSSTPAMAMPTRPPMNAAIDPSGSRNRHYVNITPGGVFGGMAGIIPSEGSRAQVGALTGYVNLDMRVDPDSDVYAHVDLRPATLGHSAPECPTVSSGGSARLNYAKLQFHDESCGGGGGGGGSQTSINAIDTGNQVCASYQAQPRFIARYASHRLSTSADQQSFSRCSMAHRDPQCDYIELDTRRTKGLSKIVCEQQPGTDHLEEVPTDEQTPSNESVGGSQPALVDMHAPNAISNPAQVVTAQQDYHNPQQVPPNGPSNTGSTSASGSNGNGGSYGGSGIPLRNPSFPKKFRNFRFSTRKNSEPNS